MIYKTINNKKQKMKMKTIYIYICIVIGLIAMWLISSYGATLRPYIPSLLVVGDIKQVVDLQEVADFNKKEQLMFNDIKYSVVDTNELMSKVDLVYESFDLYFVSYDGFMNKIQGNQLEGTYIGYNEHVGYAFISENHPPNSGIRDIENIIVVKNENEVNNDFGLTVINYKTDTNMHFSIGELYIKEYIVYPYLDGVAYKETDNIKYKVDVMKQKRLIDLDNLLGFDVGDVSVLMKDGENILLSEGYLEIMGNQLNYMIPSEKEVYRDLCEITINP